MKRKEKGKFKKKNYEKAKQNNLRFLADKRFLIPAMFFLFLTEIIIGNWVLQNIFSLLKSNLFSIQWVEFKETLFYYPLSEYLFAYILLFLASILSTSIIAYRMYTSFRSLEEEHVQGTMDFESTEGMDKQYPTVEVHPFTETEDFYDGKPGYPVGRKPRTMKQKAEGTFSIYVDTTDSNTITLAGTRQGKGIYFVDTFIDILTRARLIANRASFVMTATKGDEPRTWYNTLKRRGYRIRIANLVHSYYSDPIPALAVFNNYYRHYKRLKRESVALKKEGKQSEGLNASIQADQQLANAEKIIKQVAFSYFREVNEGKDGGFWTKACRSLFISVGIALADQEFEEHETSKVNPYTIYTVVNEMQRRKIKEQSHEFLKRYTDDENELQRLLAEYENKSELDVFFGELPHTHPARRHYNGIMASAPAHVTLGNIITHFDGDLEPFLMTMNAKMTAFDDGFDMEVIGFDREQPTAVFVLLSDADTSNNQLGVMYIEQIYQVLLNRCNLEDDSQCYRDVHFIYEEGGNLGVAISDLARKWTSGLSRRLFSHLVLQDVQQLSSLYDEDTKDIILVTKYGQCIRFHETDVRSTGRNSMGVIGMNLVDGDEVIGMQLNTQGEFLLIASEKGLGKRTKMEEFSAQNRGGKGVKCYKITDKTGNIIGIKAVNDDNEIMIITTEGIIIRMKVEGISILGRVTSGVKLINMNEDVTIASIAKVREDKTLMEEIDNADESKEEKQETEE